MEILYSAVLSELVSRAVSFLLAKREEQAAAAAQEERLRSLLLRSRTIVEEAERRLVTNRAMLQQLGALRDEAFRGYYVLDAAARFNPAKRVRVPSGDPEACRASAARLRELRQAVRGLEAMIGDMKEFVVFLTTHPLLHRQPYSAHLFVDKCMFGRHMEKERIMEFLLQPEPPGAARLGVLPIVGPAHIGKSTLVEHVCHDERVRDHFSLILFYRGKSLVDETVASFRDKCVVKHQTDNEASSGQRLLIIIELFEDLDEETWKNMLYSSERSMAQGSRMIITSRSEKIVRFGTTRALRLKCLSPEAYWHFFKMTVFGSDDPGQHPKLASLAMEMASLMQGSFLFANIGAVVLRDHFDTQSWSRAVRRIREYLQKNVSLFGEYTDDIKDKDHPRFTWSLINQKPDRYCMLYDIYERGSQEEVPEIPYSDMLAGGSGYAWTLDSLLSALMVFS
ncbi:putative disease resistance protein RGA3 [Setaria viridis]|uniref:putative disease resistance protein RGA3 n=1 Tax=Setaria viridis TaxID=4556 RepID=UPI0014936ADC|nr:putative disease resistance protein RGA3 [Setaria viridis]